MAKRKHGKRNPYMDVVEQAQELGAPDTRTVVAVTKGENKFFDTSKIRIRPTPICWGVPMDEIMFSKFFILFVRGSNWMPWDNFVTTESTYIKKARNEIHNAFLEMSDPYLMMLDSDTLIMPYIAERLMAHKKGIVGGWYLNKTLIDKPHPVIYDYFPEEDGWRHRKEPGTGLEQVDAMGAGCWLMSREVAEKLGESPYEAHKDDSGEDFLISKKMQELGIPLYVDWDLHCPHAGVGWY